MATEKRKQMVEREVDVTTCDQCHQEQPDGVMLKVRVAYRLDPRDFCSFACLAEWARTQGAVDGMIAQAIAGPQGGEP